MKFPKIQFPIACGVVAMGLLTAGSALAAALPKPAEIPPYMQQAANLNDPAYLACIRSKAKSPASSNLLENFEATLACQSQRPST